MNYTKIIAHLRANGDVFKHLFQGVSDEQVHWQPAKDRWSVLEVVNQN